ncbi:MBL fold metallo-hydrolase [Halobaculum gomorrense]|uniref:Glyoxylase, beta-lactamase superfamily II n=1 Tax=Halobaculum gomorrense TaxID=43928 RepID=A0A1M5PBB5_9EURY|nr:MBL fold metallo-hydrolase [Halobaculum gomorrense]SHG99078.1 Glyoxylase, beta-lactamase superfamily II [Halobaculum gomorrense]
MQRIRLTNTVFEGLNNVYVLDGPADGGDPDELVLVDAGVALPDVHGQLASGLADLGYEMADIDRVLLTHWHADHAGLAGAIQAESGATVHAHEADAPLVAGDEASLLEERRLQRAKFREWGMPDEIRETLVDFLDDHGDLGGEPCDVEPFAYGDAFEVNDRTLEAVHLPGHAAGLTAFFDAADDEAFVGDAILPKYTPNVGGADVRVDDPLASYVESLLTLIDLDSATAWPGHRDRIDDPAGRAATIHRHHVERTRNVVDALVERGPMTPWEVSAVLFGELHGIHVLHGPGEAYAHLDHLADAGVAERDGTRYALVDADPDVAALFPDPGIDRVVEWSGE